MTFNTLTFIGFFVAVLVLYYLVPKRFQWVFLLMSSYFFYLYAGPKFVIFMLITTVTSWYGALMIDKNHVRESEVLKENKEIFTKEIKKDFKAREKQKRKRILITILVVNFGILFFLKYLNFFTENLNHIISPLTDGGQIPRLNLILPLGISFYTFQTMSYVIDVYWKKVRAEKNIAKVALFVSFFPQILQGPIGRFGDLAPQLYQERKADAQQIKYGIQLMIWGYFKKLVIADRVAIAANHMFGDGGYNQMSGSVVALCVFLYAIQDYTDFSGCIDIARGAAQCMGINMAENFKRPYFSRTLPEFWRRWHMTLGAWMKDYVFYPFSLSGRVRNMSKWIKEHSKEPKEGRIGLGKHLGGTLPIALGNILVFFLVGVWHGSAWNYIIWGLYYGVLIAISGLLKPVFEGMNRALHINVKSKPWQLWQIIRTFWFTCVACIIFRAETMTDAWNIFAKSMHFWQLPQNYVQEYLSMGLVVADAFVIPASILILFVADVMQEHMSVRGWLERRSFILRYAIYFIGFLFIVGLGIYGPGFDQSQFVYMGF